jgi:hypothetical protein
MAGNRVRVQIPPNIELGGHYYLRTTSGTPTGYRIPSIDDIDYMRPETTNIVYLLL